MRALLFTLVYSILASVVAALISQHTQGIADAGKPNVGALVTRPEGTSLADVGGHMRIKEELRALVITPLTHPRIFYGAQACGIRPPRGVLLHGPPGTGKTLLARAVACECRVPLITLHAAALESKWWGETPKLLDAVFTAARTKYAPCLIFFDEIDSLARTRSEGDQQAVYSLKCELLRNFDTLDGGAPVVVLACTNNPRALDPALRRRFQRAWEVRPPDEAERLHILGVLTRNDSQVGDLREIARRTEGLTGSELATLYERASLARLSSKRVQAQLGRLESGAALARVLGPLKTSHWFPRADTREK